MSKSGRSDVFAAGKKLRKTDRAHGGRFCPKTGKLTPAHFSTGSAVMKIKYFTDTDTALLEFASKPVAETREISEDISIDLDAEGRLVSMTIEHAKTSASIKDFGFHELAAS